MVLIGSADAGRKRINYEISKVWTDNNGVVGIHFHNLKSMGRTKALFRETPRVRASSVVPLPLRGRVNLQLRCRFLQCAA